MLIRVRSSQGTARIEVEEQNTLADLKKKIREALPFTEFALAKNPNGSDQLTGDTVSLRQLKLSHGEMLFLFSNEKVATSSEQKVEDEVKEDEIDKILSAKDGWIPRQRDPRNCRHGANGKCLFCMPLPPWDILNQDPWKSDGTKFIPFHAFLRKHKETAGIRNLKTLEPQSYKVKACDKHPPWPEGICTECKPNACRIDSQPYRHVDNVEFESLELVDMFLQAWRQTGSQRCGYLYGKYSPDDYIPLGITASVAVIYEPPQTNTREGFTLLEDPDEERVESLAAAFGLRKIGFIWTDLQTEKSSTKLVHHRKDILMTSQEIVQSAKFQNNFPSACNQAISGKLGSKFVSVLVTANDKEQVEISAFQVSDQCMALVKDRIITYAKDPTLMKVRKSKTKFLPDVMFSAKNEYGYEVVQTANPTFPSDFFIIRLRQGAPKKPNPLFKHVQFPIENRLQASQNMALVKRQLDGGSPVSARLSDFHLLLYLSSQLNKEQMKVVIDSVLNEQDSAQLRSILQEALKSTSTPTPQPGSGGSASSGAAPQGPREKQMEDMLVSMGYNITQAREALWATGYSSAEQAIEFLLRA